MRVVVHGSLGRGREMEKKREIEIGEERQKKNQ
jgi:hypothetical protein